MQADARTPVATETHGKETSARRQRSIQKQVSRVDRAHPKKAPKRRSRPVHGLMRRPRFPNSISRNPDQRRTCTRCRFTTHLFTCEKPNGSLS